MRSGTAAKILLMSGDGGVAQYLEERPQSARRIQDELKNVPLLSGGQERGGTPAKLLLQDGRVTQYLEEMPQSARRIQDELRSVPLLSIGEERVSVKLRGVPARELLRGGEMEEYLERFPESARRACGSCEPGDLGA